MRKAAITLLAVMLGGTAAHATSLDGMTVAVELGTVLAAERPCHLSYNTDAVQRYIADHVRESDMSFGSLLQTMVEGKTFEMRSMTPATLTAFCTQTQRVAKVNGFIQ